MPNIVYLNLQKTHFDNIKSGKKTVEVRLYDEKRQVLQVWDKLMFRSSEDELVTEVTWLHRYSSFQELLNDDVIYHKLWAENKETALENMYKIYTPEQEKQYGVVGIEIILL